MRDSGGMDACIEAARRLLEQHQEEYQRHLRALPPAAVNWQPGPGMPSPAALVMEGWSATRFWLLAAAGETVQPARYADFRVAKLRPEQLIVHVERAAGEARSALRALDGRDLGRTVLVCRRAYPIADLVLRALEQSSNYLGQVSVTRRLWEGMGPEHRRLAS